MSDNLKTCLRLRAKSHQSNVSLTRAHLLWALWPCPAILTSGSSHWNSSGPRVTLQLYVRPSPPASIHVSRFARNRGLHILCSSLCQTSRNERGHLTLIVMRSQMASNRQIITSNTSDQYLWWKCMENVLMYWKLVCFIVFWEFVTLLSIFSTLSLCSK